MFKIIDKDSYPTSRQFYTSITPENVGKPFVFKSFQEVKKWNFNLKWLNKDVFTINFQESDSKSAFVSRISMI